MTRRRVALFLIGMLCSPTSLAQNQTTHGACSPAIKSVNGNVAINCYNSDAEIEAYVSDLASAHNPRFGFSIEFPRMWHGEDQASNGDGYTFRSPVNPSVSVKAHGDYGTSLDTPTDADLEDHHMDFYAPRMRELLFGKGSSRTLLKEAHAQVRIVHYKNGKKFDVNRIDGRMYVYDSSENGQLIRSVLYFTQYDRVLYNVTFSCPAEMFDKYKSMFFALAYGFTIDAENGTR